MPADADQVLVDRLSFVMDRAKAAGADSSSAVLSDRFGLSVSERMGNTTELERETQRALNVRVYLGRRMASVRVNDLSDNALDQAAQRAVDMANVVPEDPYCGLADPSQLSARNDGQGLDLNDPKDPDTQQLIDYAKAAEAAALDVAHVTNSEGATASWERRRFLSANSLGFLGGFETSNFSGFVNPVAGEGEGMQSEYEWTSTVYFDDLDAPQDFGKKAGDKAVSRLNPSRLQTATMSVIYDRQLASRFLSGLLSAISGTSIARGTSYLREHMGQQVLGDGYSVVEDPHRVRGLRSSSFDGDSLATKAKSFVENGELKTWIKDLVSARQLGQESTANGSFGGGVSTGNVALVGGAGSLDDLMADIKDGFYITSLMGQGSNMLTGDYSQGASGFRILNGKLAEPVENMTVAGHLLDMMKRARFADDMRYKSGIDAPSMRIDNMSVAGL